MPDDSSNNSNNNNNNNNNSNSNTHSNSLSLPRFLRPHRRIAARPRPANSPHRSLVAQPPSSNESTTHRHLHLNNRRRLGGGARRKAWRPAAVVTGLVLCVVVFLYLTLVVVVARSVHTNDGNNVNEPDAAFSFRDQLQQQQQQQVPLYTKDQAGKEHPTETGKEKPRKGGILTAYLEDTDYDTWLWQQPLPNRTATAQAARLQKRLYPRVRSCSNLLQQWPTDPPDEPASGDPFLPWIHDVFPAADGRFVHVVAQNLRRCQTGRGDADVIRARAGQAALFQHVPVKRVVLDEQTRYQLTTHDQADADGVATRFVCKFSNGQETLSVFHFDYDWIAHRKRYRGTFIEDDGGIKSIHTSQLIFSCPIPDELQDAVRTGRHVTPDDWTTLFLDLVPLRTPPRYGPADQFFQPRYKAEESQDPAVRFDPVAAWGPSHVMPALADSGRWANIPICLPSLQQYETNPPPSTPRPADFDALPRPADFDALSVHPQYPPPVKKHRMVSCLWASAGYKTRGERFAINDGQRRLLEWITYHQDVLGFDHVYLYDNSGAFGNETSLKGVADLFPDTVTYIPWPSQICNNRQNNVDSPGERSSQYAAEASCRLRFGPHVDWIGQFDLDEYFVPMGNHSTITTLLDQWEAEDSRILSFASWRAWPRWAKIAPIEAVQDKHLCWSKEPCFDLSIPLEYTFLQAYNCDRQKPGQKKAKMPAEKQIYRPDYVTHHFVHYSAVTVLSEKNRTEWQKEGLHWKPRPFPDLRQRFGKEPTEGLMIHTKAVARQDTAGWESACHKDNLELPPKQRVMCRLGLPWPEPWPADPETAAVKATPEGWAFNCFVNPKVENEFAPKLQEALVARAPFLTLQ
jgi:hypothetical protein